MPLFLANVTMETYFQAGIRWACTIAGPPEGRDSAGSTLPFQCRQQRHRIGCGGNGGRPLGLHALPSQRLCDHAPLNGDFSWFLTRNIATSEPERLFFLERKNQRTFPCFPDPAPPQVKNGESLFASFSSELVSPEF